MVDQLTNSDQAGTPTGEPRPPESGQPDGHVEHPTVHYEGTDVSFLGILLIFVVIVCIGSFLFTVIWWYYKEYNAYESTIKKSPFPLASSPAMKLPREPRLEQLDRAVGIEKPNVYRMEKSEEEILQGLGPTDESGFVHIPIELAMKVVADRLSVTAKARPQANKSNGLLDAGGPNSGRIFQEGPP